MVFPFLVAFFLGGAATVAGQKLLEKRRSGSGFNNDNNGGGGDNNRASGLFRPLLPLSTQVLTSRTNSDHVNLITDLLRRMWPYINQAAAVAIKQEVEPLFAEILPSPLKSLRFTRVDFGKVPILIDNAVVHDVDPNHGSLQLDVDVLWDSNSDIRLKTDFTGSFGVKTIRLRGRLSILLKPLISILPIVGALQVAFIHPPQLELEFSGLASIADLSVIDKTIRKILNDVVRDLLVLPNRLTVKLDESLDFRTVYQPPIGVARITVERGRGFVIEKRKLQKDDIPDVYCRVSMGGNEAWTTSVQKDNLKPVWNETHDFVLSDNDQVVLVEAWDEDTGTLDPDDFLGKARVSVGDLLLAGGKLEVPLVDKHHASTDAFVTIRCGVQRFTSMSLSSLSDASKHHVGGIIVIVIGQAYDVPSSALKAGTCVRVSQGKTVFTTDVVAEGPGIDARNPTFDKAYLIEIRSNTQARTPIEVEVRNGRKVLGKSTVTVGEIVGSEHYTVAKKGMYSGGVSLDFSVAMMGVKEARITSSIGGKLTLAPAEPSLEDPEYENNNGGGKYGRSGQAQQRHNTATTSASSLSPSSSRSTQSGKIRVGIRKGRGFQIQRRRLRKDDIPDVYVKVRFGASPTIWRTHTIKDDVSPNWGNSEEKDYFMTSLNQVLSLDVWDANRRTKDDYLGSRRITVGKILLRGGTAEVELQTNGVGTGAYITVTCERLV